MTERFAGDGDVVLQNSAHTFDSSVWQLLWPITRGAMTVVPDREQIVDFDATAGPASPPGGHSDTALKPAR